MIRSRRSPHRRSKISIQRVLIVSCLALSSIHGVLSSGAIQLSSIQIFNTHEWIAPTPTVYFYCQGEKKMILPDVKEKHFLYSFKGHESWQPLTELPDKKCKRCGLYELDKVKTDDIFDEWELCRDDFVDGSYMHYKEKEFNATFLCPECIPPTITISSNSNNGASKKKSSALPAVLLGLAVSAVVVAGIVGMHNYWKKRKREQDQARFLKLFEETDDLDDELEQF